MTQALMFYVGPPDQLNGLSRRLESEGFEVSPANRAVPGIHVRVRTGTADEETVERIAAEVAPSVKRGPGAAPTHDFRGYREERS